MKRFYSIVCFLLLAVALLPRPISARAASAPGLTDLGQALHQEAILLMVDLGIIQGKEDGSFDPEGSVDRATLSNMLFNLLMNGSDPSLFSGVESHFTDIKGHWAENDIKYCSSVGIISGKGDGTFDPDGVVNVAAAAKMFLVTLGYDAIDRGYASDPLWSDHIMRDAQAAGLLDGVGQFSFEPLTRDNAAQMLYNALFAHSYTPNYALRNGVQVITGYTEKPITLGLETFGLVRYTVLVGDVTSKPRSPMVNYRSIFPTADAINDKGGILTKIRSGFAIGPELAASYAILYVKANWTLSPEKDRLQKLTLERIYSSALTARPLAVLGSSVDGTPIAGDGVCADLTRKAEDNGTFIAELSPNNASYFLNGVCVPLEQANAAAVTPGVRVELLDSGGTGHSDMVRVTVESVAVIAQAVDTRVTEGTLQIRVPGIVGLSDWTDARNVTGWESLEVDDVALYATVGTRISIKKLEGAQKMLVHSGEAVLLDATEGRLSQLPGAVEGWPSADGKFLFFFDHSGGVVSVQKN